MALKTLKALMAAGAFALAASGCAGGAQAGESTVVVEIEHSRFQPGHFEFDAGETVTFVVRNADPIAHEFLIGDQEMQDIHEKGTEAHHGARPGELSIPAGEQRTTTFTFDDSGTLLVGCHLPGHWDYGMRGSIDID